MLFKTTGVAIATCSGWRSRDPKCDDKTLKELQGLASDGEHAGRPPANLITPESEAYVEIARKNFRIE
jgi:hypothetical protein